jgi:hypothetical protein
MIAGDSVRVGMAPVLRSRRGSAKVVLAIIGQIEGQKALSFFRCADETGGFHGFKISPTFCT